MKFYCFALLLSSMFYLISAKGGIIGKLYIFIISSSIHFDAERLKATYVFMYNVYNF